MWACLHLGVFMIGYTEINRLDAEENTHQWRKFSHVRKRMAQTEIVFYFEHIIIKRGDWNIVSASRANWVYKDCNVYIILGNGSCWNSRERRRNCTGRRAWKAWWPCQDGMSLTQQCPPAGPSKGAFAPISRNKGSADQSSHFQEKLKLWILTYNLFKT